MNRKQTSQKTNNSRTVNKEASANRLASPHTSYHRRCCESSETTKDQRVYSKLPRSPPTAPHVRAKAGLPPKSATKPNPTPSQKLDSSASQADPSCQQAIDSLNTKFEQLSSSILDIATSRAALDVRSLDLLLTKHIGDSLGAAVNDPDCCRPFINATRDLLVRLTALCEEGKISPQLLKKDSSRRFIRAKSSSTVCYRDRYLKELVMNSLQSMCSDAVEAEVAKVSRPIRSAASQERINAIKEMIRAEAGITPEPFLELERELAALRRKLSQNALRLSKEARRVDDAILKQTCESSDDYVQIPMPARKILRGRQANVKLSKEVDDHSSSSESEEEDSSSCKLKKNNASSKSQEGLNTRNIEERHSSKAKSEAIDPNPLTNNVSNLKGKSKKVNPNYGNGNSRAYVLNDMKGTNMSRNSKTKDFLGSSVSSQDHMTDSNLNCSNKDSRSECLETTCKLTHATVKTNKLNTADFLGKSIDDGNMDHFSCDPKNPLLCKVTSECASSSVDITQHVKSESLNNSECQLQDSVEFVRPLIDQIVQEEINRVKEKGRLILNEVDVLETEKTLKESFQRYSDILDHKTLTDEDDDDEISEEETKLFLEALKADVEGRIRDSEKVLHVLNSRSALESIDEEDEFSWSGDTKENLECQINAESTNSMGNFTKETCLEFDKNTVQNSSKQENFKVSFNNDMASSPVNKTSETEALLQRVKSKSWWFSDTSLVDELMKEMKQEFQRLNIKADDDTKDTNTIVDSKPDYTEKIENSHKITENDNEFTVEEMANILANVSVKIVQLPLYLNEEKTALPSTTRKEEILKILRILQESLGDSIHFDASTFAIEDQKQFLTTTKGISEGFSLLAERLSRSPLGLKKQPFSILNPPESLNKTLADLASTAYFRDSFIRGILQAASDNNSLVDKCLTSTSSKLWLDATNVSKDDSKVDSSKEFKIVKPYDSLAEQKSSGDIEPILPGKESSNRGEIVIRRVRDVMKPNDIEKNLFNFEHYLGYTASVMTVQNVSDMFLFLSTVLNDIPSRIKTERIVNLQPPSTLLRALEILYFADDEDTLPVLEKKVSFSSLTVQNASDIFLTLSKTFQDTPPRVRNSTVLDLNPPESLLLAIHMLTSLSHNSVLESRSLEEVQHEEEALAAVKSESREDFFDAVDSLSSLDE